MKWSKRLVGLFLITVVIVPSKAYAGHVEVIEMTDKEKNKAKDAFEENLKIAEQYGINVPIEVGDILTQLEVKEIPQVASNAESDFRKGLPQQRETEVWQKNNFLDMRINLEKLTGTQVTSDKPYGILYTTYGSDILGGDWENRSTTDINYIWGVGNKYMEEWMKDGANRKELSKLASTTFKDIKGNEWFAPHIPTAVYFGVINGYPDGTFKGNAPVSRAEFAAMIGNTNRSFIAKEDVGFSHLLTAHKNQWYYTDMRNIYDGPMGIYGLSVNDMNSGMTRGEVAVVIANAFFPNDVEDYNKVSKSSFKDIKSLTKAVSPMHIAELNDKGAREEYMKQLKTPNSCPKDVVASLNVLKAKGVMGGDENGNSNWTKTVTRGEAIALLERCAQLQ